MRLLRALALGLALLGAAAPSRAQVYGMCGASTPCKIWYGQATTNSSGAWSATIPAGIFTSTPVVSPMALSADNTLANQASVQMVAPTIASGVVTLSGTVTLPNTITVGGSPNKAAGAGLVVVIQAMGY